MLTGGRVKVSLHIGAMSQDGDMALAPASKFSADWFETLAKHGFTRPVAGVRAANVGRSPVTVVHWSLEAKRGVWFHPVEGASGPVLPHRLEAGETQMWTVDLPSVHDLLADISQTRSGRVKVNGLVELANGRKRRSREVIRQGLFLVPGQSPPATARTPPPP